MTLKLKNIYSKLYKEYGAQGWWPINGKYHKGNYDFPKNTREQFEIIIGAILTQNTSWLQVEKALKNLRKLKCIDAEQILKLDKEILKEAIKPTGYFNQKTEYLIRIAEFYNQLRGKTPSRKELLAVKGIGPETADSILLYAYKQPEFVIDAYTKRILTHNGLIDETANYNKLKEMFEKNIEKDFKTYQEYHALIVEHAKNHYQKNLMEKN